MRVLNGFSNESDRWPLTVESRAGKVAALLGWPRCSADRTVWLAGLLGWPRCLAGCSACLAACFRLFISLRGFEANGPYFLIANVFLFVLSNGVFEVAGLAVAFQERSCAWQSPLRAVVLSMLQILQDVNVGAFWYLAFCWVIINTEIVHGENFHVLVPLILAQRAI